MFPRDKTLARKSLRGNSMSFHSMQVWSEEPKCYMKFKVGHTCLDDRERSKLDTGESD